MGPPLLTHFLRNIAYMASDALHAARVRLSAAIKPATLADLARSKPELIAENALLRQ